MNEHTLFTSFAAKADLFKDTFFNNWCALIQGCSAHPASERCRDWGGCNHSGTQDWQPGRQKSTRKTTWDTCSVNSCL